MLNHIQDTKLREATDRSRDLYTALWTNVSAFSQIQLKPAEARTQIAPETITEFPEQPIGGSPVSDTPLPVRPFKRRAPGSTADGPRRRMFQKVDLTQDEIQVGSVQVPEPPKESLRVPPPRRPRRITRIRPEEVGVPTKKD
jgi:hypothetical protein